MDLEALTNKQLRAKCMEYGLPNVPVTDTSRKILIRKLNAAMNGTTTTTTKKAATSTPTNKSRKTMHATITTTVSSGDDDEDNFIIKTQRTNNNTETRRRQTTHVAPVVATMTTKATAAKPRSIASATNQSYERIIPVTHSTTIGDSFADRNSERQRRSVSLTKTGVLTTSYSTETVKTASPAAAAAINEDDYVDLQEEEEEDDELEDVEMENVELQRTAAPSQVYTHPTYAGYNQSNAVFNIPQAPSAPSMAAATNKLYPDLHSTGLQHDYYSGLDGMRASQSSSARLSQLGYSRNAPTSYMPSTMAASSDTAAATSSTQRQTIGFNVFNTPSAPGYQSNLPSTSTSAATKRYTIGGGITKRHTARAIDNDELAASSSDDQYEAPYLTKFSRNLENMKPEPIYKRNSAGGASYSSPSYMGMQRRRGAYEREDGVSLSQLWAKLDQKYHLQTALYFVLFFLFVVFVYVFFLQ